MATLTSTLTKQQKESTFAHTIKTWSRSMERAIKALQMAEEDNMTAEYDWEKKDAIQSAQWEIDDIILYAQSILDEAKGAKDAYNK